MLEIFWLSSQPQQVELILSSQLINTIANICCRLKMIGHSFISILLLFVFLVTISSYKILVVPWGSGFNSRLLNLQKLADILAQDGHDVTVLMNTRISEHAITKYAKSIEYYVPEETSDVNDIELSQSSIWNIFSLFNEIMEKESFFERALMSDTATLKKIYNTKFDLIFGDAIMHTNLLAAHLEITTILYLNVLMPFDSNIFLPITPSMTCILPGMSCSPHDMDFKGRVINYITYLGMKMFWRKTLSIAQQAAEEHNFTFHVPLADAFKNKVTIINAHYVLDMPLPTMPHVFPISGLYHKEPSPLLKEFSDIVKSSKPHGVILLSFGTLMPEFDADKADIFARVLGRLSHSVIWRFTGTPPKSLKSNTHLVKWFPQNDLLANPAVKLFITHCGISSTFESALHGVPVVTVPLFADQEDNAGKLVQRAMMGKRIDFYSLEEEQLEQSIREVLDNPIYKDNAKKTSYLLNNHLVEPRKQLRHLVNFTVESGGAPHLFHPYAVDMNWFQFHSLDVIFCISATLLAVAFILFFACRLTIRLLLHTLATYTKEKLS